MCLVILRLSMVPAEADIQCIDAMQTRDIISELLNERQELLVLFCRLMGMEPFASHRPALDRLAQFCQTLVDYAGLAHFELFEKLIDDASDQPPVRARAKELYQPLVDNTQLVVAFNDKYDGVDHEMELESLAEDLSELGEVLAARFEIEDALITLVRQAA